MKLPHVSTLLILVNLAAGAPSYSRVTFHSDVLPILQKRCQECHHSGEIRRMSLISYRDTWPLAKGIKQAVHTRKMPPMVRGPWDWHAKERQLLGSIGKSRVRC
jgi:hypothetical protein